MGKKKGKKGESFADRLARQLAKGTPEDLSQGAAREGVSSVQFHDVFEQARTLLAGGADPRKVVALPPVFQIAFLLLAQAGEDDEQINDLLAMTTDREVKKEAKRILHRLRSRGLKVSGAEEPSQSILDRRVLPEDPILPCYLTPVTASGIQMLWIARYVRGGVGIYQVEVSDEDGLLEFAGGTIGRSRYRDLTKELLADKKNLLLQIPYPEAWHRLSRAVERSRETSHALPEGYLDAKNNLPEPEAPALALDPKSLFPKTLLDHEPNLVREAAALHELPEFADWIPDAATVKQIQTKLQEVETSLITINAAQKVDQVKKAFDLAVSNLLEDQEHRERFQQRLFEMTAFLFRIDRKETARLAAAAAWQLSHEGFQPLNSPFFERLVKKMFKTPEEIVEQMGRANLPPKKEAPSESGSLVLPP